ncbi:MAG: DUF3822 family protein [Paramuribaculum sp.]|nr:DUF3822 family protein [Paramuribaculum sp.]
MIDKDLIPQSHLWTLGLLIGRRSIDAVFFPPEHTDDIIVRSITLDPAAPSHLKAIEEAVYDNPALLNPYRAVFALVDGDCFTILPDALGDNSADLAAKAIELTSGNPSCPRMCITGIPLDGCGATLYFGMEADLAGFLRRTFFNISLAHPLKPLIESMTSREEPSPAVAVSLHDGRLTLVCADASGLRVANMFSCAAVADAAYYTLAARRAAAFDSDAPILVAADPSERDAVTAMIAQADPQASTAPLPLPPSLWRAGTAIASAPLSLLINHTRS